VGNTLQDQLLKAGLVDKNKAQKAEKERRKKNRQQHKSKESISSPAERKKQTQKVERDRDLNQRREEARKQREIAAQVKQLVENHRHPRGEGEEDDTPFYFNNKGKIKKMYVSAQTHKMVTSKKLGIVNCNGVFELVPMDIVEKVRQRNPSLVIELPEDESPSEDDPYSDFPVPDDLIW
jgi:uncharacterized protein YaiL (DUF2058 family)